MKKLTKWSVTTMIFGSFLFGTQMSAPQENVVAAGGNNYTYQNCTQFNKKYRYGVKKYKNTKNRVRYDKRGRPVYKVTKAKTSLSIYNAAVKYNPDLDRDKDNIACER